MYIYFLLLRIASLFGHRKARLLVRGQARTLQQLGDANLKGAVWFHAASVGEFEQARPMIERLRSERPNVKILLSFFSPSGYELRKDYPMVDKVVYLPFATRANARKMLDALQPSMAVFVKYEFWPAYLKQLRKRNIPTYLISAIFRPGQLFFRPWGIVYRNVLRSFTHLFVQDTDSAELLAKYKITNVTVAGDTRFDRVAHIHQQAKSISQLEGFVDGARNVIVAGSTWPEDEQLLARYVENRPGVKLVLVPHEIHESHLHRIFQYFHGRYIRFTQVRPNIINCSSTMLIDTIGLLSSIYRYGQVAYVGGGFGVGIHNTIEAAVWGMPVVFGPNYQHFREAKGLIAAGAGFSVKNYQQLEAVLDNALSDAEALGRLADQYVRSELGATDLIYNQLFSHHNS